MRTQTVVLVGVAVLGIEPVAQACSGSDCFPPQVIPDHDGVVMPVNAAGIAWYSGGGSEDAVVLLDVEANVELPVAVDNTGPVVGLYPAEALEPGKQYRFELPDGGCGLGFGRAFFTAPAVELTSTELGSLDATPPEYARVPVPESVVCTSDVDAVSVQFEIALAPQLEPFAELLTYETLVDGEPWSHQPSQIPTLQFGGSWVGRGVDVVFASCPNGGSDGVSPGVHQVQMLARIPGLPGTVLESDVVEIVLECEVPSDTGDDDDDDDETGSFVAVHDPVDERDGCGCTTGARDSPAPALLPLLLLVGIRHRDATGPTRGC